MRLCFLSYEYPPDTGIGGIATYVYQAARLLSERGVDVEVICATARPDYEVVEQDRLRIIRIHCTRTKEFRILAPQRAAARHAVQPFHLVEAPEFNAEGLYVKENLPGVPLVIRLHTPRFWIKELNDYYYDQSWFRRLKKQWGLGYRREKDPEYRAIRQADYIVAPSLSLREIVTKRWSIPPEKIHHLPNPYITSERFLRIAPGSNTQTVLYIGRLETRKGVYNLAKAIPLVLERVPDARFVFLGNDSRGPRREKSMKSVLLQELGDAAAQVEFVSGVPLAEVPDWLSQAAVCVFPSLWENFPNVCLEAMQAARGIVASSQGGMKDMLADIRGGWLVSPQDPKAIVEGIVAALQEPGQCREAGLRCRAKVLEYYAEKLVDETIHTYRRWAGL
jgi:glycosyltransferase involved in cell wall biosynthesis